MYSRRTKGSYLFGRKLYFFHSLLYDIFLGSPENDRAFRNWRRVVFDGLFELRCENVTEIEGKAARYFRPTENAVPSTARFTRPYRTESRRPRRRAVVITYPYTRIFYNINNSRVVNRFTVASYYLHNEDDDNFPRINTSSELASRPAYAFRFTTIVIIIIVLGSIPSPCTRGLCSFRSASFLFFFRSYIVTESFSFLFFLSLTS